MCGNELRDLSPECFAGRGDHILLGAAGIHDERIVAKVFGDGGEGCRHLSNRRRNDGEISVTQSDGELGRGVDNPAAGFRSTPIISTLPARLCASANEQPIRPVPMMAILFMRGWPICRGLPG
jgi:hypothetical protein